jgi:hypothetical protein
LTATIGPGFDSNPLRIVGVASLPDGFFGLSMSGRGRLDLSDDQQLQGRYDLGARLFLRGKDELAVQQLEIDWALQLGRLLLGAEVAAKWRLSHAATEATNRDYADGTAELFADWAFTREVSARLAAGAHLFRYWPTAGYQPPPEDDPLPQFSCGSSCYDWAGPQFVASLRWQPSRRHVATLALFGLVPFYKGWARLDDGSYLQGWRRRDRQLGGQLAYSFRGPVAVQVGYSYLRDDSTSFGEANERHRLWAAASARLFWRLFGSAQAAWQLIRYPDGVFLSQSLLLLDDESQSSLGAKLAVELIEHVDLELRYSVYWIALPPAHGEAAGTAFWRHTAFLGLTLRL